MILKEKLKRLLSGAVSGAVLLSGMAVYGENAPFIEVEAPSCLHRQHQQDLPDDSRLRRHESLQTARSTSTLTTFSSHLRALPPR